MSDNDTTILEGPDGRLYQIPKTKLAEFEMPGDKVMEYRQRRAAQPVGDAAAAFAAESSGCAALPDGHYRPGELPPGHPGADQDPGASAVEIQPNGRGGVVLNFYFSGGPPKMSMASAYPPAESGIEGYHMTFDEQGVPVNHTDMLWGDYIDKQGNPAVGFHSHDPVTGNAQ